MGRRVLGMLGANSAGLPHSHPAPPGITGILMSAAGLPVCLTRPPKLVLHPPPVSKSEIKSIPGVSNTSRKTTKKQAKKGIGLLILRGTGSQSLAASLNHGGSSPRPDPLCPDFCPGQVGLTSPCSDDSTEVDCV